MTLTTVTPDYSYKNNKIEQLVQDAHNDSDLMDLLLNGDCEDILEELTSRGITAGELAAVQADLAPFVDSASSWFNKMDDLIDGCPSSSS